MKRFILASSSPTRQKFFEKFPIKVEVIPSNFEEDMTLGLKPEELAIRLSAGKARDVAKSQKNAVVLGIDTFMLADGKLLGKPETHEKAKEMLRLQAKKPHQAISGITVIDTDSGQEISDISTAIVTFRPISEEELDDYVSSGEPLDKAGAYASLEMGSVFIEKVEGDFYTLSGVPIAKISQMLAKFGIDLLKKN